MKPPGSFSCALIVLAAGASTRMKYPKQLLPVGGVPLLRHVVVAALASPVTRVIVVLGANAKKILPVLDGLPVQVVINQDWAAGMGTSLRAGMEALGLPEPEAVIVALADQPGFTADHVTRLITTARKTPSTVVASEVDGVRLPPALFKPVHFPALRAASAESGARELLSSRTENVTTIPWLGGDDLDTQLDYENYLLSKDAATRHRSL